MTLPMSQSLVAYVNVNEDVPDSIKKNIPFLFLRIWIHCAQLRPLVGRQTHGLFFKRLRRNEETLRRRGTESAAAAAFEARHTRKGRRLSSRESLCEARKQSSKGRRAFAARQTAAFTKPKGRNMKQTTISKALLYARLDLLKVMFSVALLPKINFIINLAYYRQVARCTQSPCNIY